MGKIMGLIDDVDPMPKGLGEKVVRQSVPVAVPKVRGRESELLPRGITVLPDGKWNFDPEGSERPPGPAAPEWAREGAVTGRFSSESENFGNVPKGDTQIFSVGDRVRVQANTCGAGASSVWLGPSGSFISEDLVEAVKARFKVGDRVRWTWGSGKENGPGQITSLDGEFCDVIFPENPHGIFLAEECPAYISLLELEHLP